MTGKIREKIMKIKGKIEDSLLLSLYMEEGEPQVFPSGF